MNPTTVKRTYRALLFVLIVIALILAMSCSKPAERVIRSQRPAIFKFNPGYEYFIDNAAINFNSLLQVTNYTDPYDNRWARPNTYVYAEQIQWGHLYFTDITQKAQFDYSRIYGSPMPVDTLVAHIVASADTLMTCYYQAYQVYGGSYTVEQFDFWIENGELSLHAEQKK